MIQGKLQHWTWPWLYFHCYTCSFAALYPAQHSLWEGCIGLRGRVNGVQPPRGGLQLLNQISRTTNACANPKCSYISPSCNLPLSIYLSHSLCRSLIAPSAFCGSVRKCRHSNGICFGLVPCAKYRALFYFHLVRTATTALGLSILWVCVCANAVCKKPKTKQQRLTWSSHSWHFRYARFI